MTCSSTARAMFATMRRWFASTPSAVRGREPLSAWYRSSSSFAEIVQKVISGSEQAAEISA